MYIKTRDFFRQPKVIETIKNYAKRHEQNKKDMSKTKKTIWQKFEELNEKDGRDGTQHLKLSTDFIGAQKDKRGGVISMGVDAGTMHEVAMTAFGGPGKMVILMVIDREEFDKL